MILLYFCSSSGLAPILLYNDFSCPRLNSKFSGSSASSFLQGKVTWYLPFTFLTVSLKCFLTLSLSSILSGGVMPMVSNFQNSSTFGGASNCDSIR